MQTFLVKVTKEENIKLVLAQQTFVQQDIYNFEDEIHDGDLVFIYFGGDSAQVTWDIGLRAIGRVARGPHDKGYSTEKPRYFRISVAVLHVLDDSISPESTKIHEKYAKQIYHVPYVGANHFPNQAIAKTDSEDAIAAVVNVYCEHVNSKEESANVRGYFHFSDAALLRTATFERELKFKAWVKTEGRVPGKFEEYTNTIRKFGEKVNAEIPAYHCDVNNFFEYGDPAIVQVILDALKNIPDFIAIDKKSNSWWTSPINKYIAFLSRDEASVAEGVADPPPPPANLNMIEFANACKDIGLKFPDTVVTRFVAALLAKPFVILTGLSGSGKTKLAQAFLRWLVPVAQYRLVPVGADWANNEHLLGYANALNEAEYVMPDTGVLDLMLNARDNPTKPFFLILDEMNLSHVERYFADFLSAMESNEKIHLYKGAARQANGKDIPQEIQVPKNLFVIGTVNIDETTYMFSPKVLDRAQVIEFRVNADEMNSFLEASPDKEIDFPLLDGKGAGMAESFLNTAMGSCPVQPGAADILKTFFNPLSKIGAEFGYRTAKDFMKFVGHYMSIAPDPQLDNALDFAIMQKLLPKLHGSTTRLSPVLDELLKLCAGKYLVSAEKLERMSMQLKDNGYASFAEA